VPSSSGSTVSDQSLSPITVVGQRHVPSSPRSAGNSSSSGSSRFSSASIHVRKRQALRPRKTVKELEEEYHDSDEDVPDDAVIWNVPISPRPPHERELRRVETDPGLAHGPSLDRTDSGLSSTSAPASLAVEEPKMPLTPHSPALSDAGSTDYPHRMQSMSRRDAALSDLCPEAKELTEALEMHAETTERHLEERIQNGLTKVLRSASPPAIKVDLPPMRRNDPLIDPLPISKEKEKFLTRTRPSWLPPKSQKEERRHLKEFQKMMVKAAEAEKRRQSRQHKLQCERDSAALDREKEWNNHVLPNWTTAAKEARTRQLCWHGISPQIRGTVWSRAIGNELSLPRTSYGMCLTRANDVEARLSTLSEENREQDPYFATFAAITSTACNIHPALAIFQPNGPLYVPLLNVSKAYTVYQPLSTQATREATSLAALLLLQIPDPISAFITLANMLHRPLLSALLIKDHAALQPTFTGIMTKLAERVPSLHAHLVSLSNRSSASSACSDRSAGSCSSSVSALDRSGSIVAEVLTPVLASLAFGSPAVGVEIATRVWDGAVFEGDSAMAAAAVAVLEKLEGRLYGGRLEEVVTELGATSDVNETAIEAVESLRSGWDEREPSRGRKVWDLGDLDEFVNRVKDVE
jgi:hypothetical protein